nr:hypothetical protein [Thiolinea sp.]
GAEPLGLVSMMLSDPERLQALNPVDVAACEACLAQLADALVYGSLTETVFTALLDWLAQADDPRLASLLWSVLTALEQQSGYDVRVDRVLAAMGNMASVPAILVVVRQWLDWSSLRLSGMAGDTFAAGVHETLSGLLLQLQDQQTVGRQLLVLYRELEPGQARHLLQIGPPGLLLQVGYQHLERGDTVVFNGLLQQLPDMSSIDMPGVLLGFERRLQAYGMDDAALREAALAWVAHQAGDEEVFNLLDDWVAHGRLAWPERQLLEAMLAVAGQP